MIAIYEVFKAEVAKIKRLRKLTNADIGEMTGFRKSTIDLFMTSPEHKARDDSEAVAQAIAKALEIEL
ncbi:MAG: hypothetical protein J6N15_01060 [Ruminiclostridium sp.]|nr:hypothetical protein [Ruminiclostridium sp.]